MTVSTAANQTRRALVWITYLLASFWLALALVWWLFARLDYGYPLWYQVLDIDSHIATYAPQNPRKPGFAQLAPEQHIRAFTQIRQSVHTGRPDLTEIVYPGPDGEPLVMLTEDEITHLGDVRQLLDRAALATALVGLLWFPLAWLVVRAGRPLPGFVVMTTAGIIALAGAILAIFGPTAVFYQFHVWLSRRNTPGSFTGRNH